MTMLEVVFWSALVVVVYAYAGYGLVVYGLVRLKRAVCTAPPTGAPAAEPSVALIVPAFNEADCIAAKIANSQALDYPRDKLRILIVTDGSTDGTPEIARRFTGVEVLHRPERLGKAAAINHAVDRVRSAIVVLSDANTALNREAIRQLIRHYADPDVGGVSGEKRIRSRESAAAVGEGLYWRYESLLKRLDSELWTVVGAAGELLSFRRELFDPLEDDSILDDFVLSLRIAARGYRVAYEPEAYAIEAASASVGEELKRRIRIAAGGWQSMVRLRALLNPRSHPTLFFQYVSHRVLRWSLVPLCLLLVAAANIAIAFGAGPRASGYRWLLWGQLAFYGLAFAGYVADRSGYRIKVLFPPYYFVITNYAAAHGFARFLTGRQPALWDRARRALLLLLLLQAPGDLANAQDQPAAELVPAYSRPNRQVRLNAVHYDNFLQSPEGRPKRALWGSGFEGRWLTQADSPGDVRLYGDADVIWFPGLAPTFGVGTGLRRDRLTTAFDANVSYLWNRPSAEVGDEFDRADMLHFQGEYRVGLFRAAQIVGQARYRREEYELAPAKKNDVWEVNPSVRYRLLGSAFTPEAGVLIGRRDGHDPNHDYDERALIVGTTSSILRSRVYVGARYRHRLRHYSIADSARSNFDRTDRRQQLTVTLAIALSRELSWITYYARERGRSSSSSSSGNFTAGFLSTGLGAQF